MITKKSAEEMAEYVRGTVLSVAAIASEFNLPKRNVEDILLKEDVERCPGCCYWWDSCEMDEEGYCPDCMGKYSTYD
jgi:hypothetical protein